MERDEKGRFKRKSDSGGSTAKEKVYAVGFKGFGPGMVCRGKQYAENTVFEEPKAEMCDCGIHFCENPMDVLDYYGFLDDNANFNEFAPVEALAPANKSNDGKSVTKKLRIGAKLDIAGFVKAAVDFVFARVEKNNRKHNSGYKSVASNSGYKSVASNSGDNSVASNSGDNSVASNSGYNSVASNSGYNSVASNSGDNSVASNSGYNSVASNSGYNSVASNSGYNSVASNSGDNSVASNSGYNSVASNSGDNSVASNSGYNSVASNSGDNSVASNSGYNSVASNSGDNSVASNSGKESFAIATGIEGKVKGALGCFIACAEWKKDQSGELHPVCFLSAKVDGKTIKADTWYTVENGKFKEVEE